jgi:uncharacterized protein HemX
MKESTMSESNRTAEENDILYWANYVRKHEPKMSAAEKILQSKGVQFPASRSPRDYNLVLIAMEEYKNESLASLQQENERLKEKSDANEQCWKEAVTDYNQQREVNKQLHETIAQQKEEIERLRKEAARIDDSIAEYKMALEAMERNETANKATIKSLVEALHTSNQMNISYRMRHPDDDQCLVGKSNEDAANEIERILEATKKL